jgi:hypothetical protein
MTALPSTDPVAFFAPNGPGTQMVKQARQDAEALPFDAAPVPMLEIGPVLRLGKFTLTAKGVSGRDASADTHDIVKALAGLEGLKDSVNWWTADLLVLGEMNGDDLAEALGVDEVSGHGLLNRRRVARAYPLAQRCQRKAATFWMHAEVAHLPQDVRMRMLNAADSVTEIRGMKRDWLREQGHDVDEPACATVRADDPQGSAQRIYTRLGMEATRALYQELARLVDFGVEVAA